MCEYLLSGLVYPNGSSTLQKILLRKLCSVSNDVALAQTFWSSPFVNSL